MRYDAGHKGKTRARIVRSAARAMRLRGPSEVAVADVMADAGLTHGGFYAHFASKEALMVDAIELMFADGQRPALELDQAVTNDTLQVRKALGVFLASYLSIEHRDRPERGCPLPALSSDIARGTAAVQARFAAGIDRLASRIEVALARLGVIDPRAESMAVIAQIVGAVGLARSVGKCARSDAILRDTLTVLWAKFDL